MISDFRCTFDNAIGISPEITKDLKLSFPDAYMHADTMAKIAHAMKQKEGAAFCMLPFCHTVEAEAMGGIVNMGDGNLGPRAKEYCCTSAADFRKLIIRKVGFMRCLKRVGDFGNRESMWH